MNTGRSYITATDWADVVRFLRGQVSPSRIVLFGSRAYGTPGEESDIDLLVVMPRPPSRQQARELSSQLRRQEGLPVQLVFMSVEEFEETRDVVGGLAYPAHHWGRVLYESNT